MYSPFARALSDSRRLNGLVAELLRKMEKQVNVKFIPNDLQQSEYNWANIAIGDKQVGKIRGKIAGNTITIFSMMIYPEFREQGYGKQAIDILKTRFNTIVAGHVKHSKIDFWKNQGFVKSEKWNYEYHGENIPEAKFSKLLLSSKDDEIGIDKSQGLSVKILPAFKNKVVSDNVYLMLGDTQIGSSRCMFAGRTIIIYTIVIYPRYRGHGYGKKAISYFKKTYDTVIADNVTKRATGFWQKMKFNPIEKWRKWDYIYSKVW